MATALDKYADMKPTWDYPVVLESHINGIRTKEMNPNTPISYDEIAEDAIRCWEAGAGAIHAHNTSFDLLGENAYKDYMRSYFGVTAQDAAWNRRVTAYNPNGGVKGYGAAAAASYKFNESWSTTVQAGYERLQGHAAKSPIVKSFGKRDQITLGASLSYSFSWKGF